MGKGKQSPIAMMAASNFYRVLLDRLFQHEQISAESEVPSTTVMLTQLSHEKQTNI